MQDLNQQINTFTEALKAKNQEKLKQLLVDHPDLLEATAPNGISLLLYTAYFKNSEILKYFLEHKTKLSFFEAAATGHQIALTKHLETTSIDVNAYSNDGFTALGYACYFAQPTSVKTLLQASADVNKASNNDFKVAPIHSAVASQQMEILQLLCDAGADINLKQMSGVTALHSAAHHGNIEMITYLLAKGADKSIKTNDGKTAADYAVEHGVEVVQLFK